MLVFLTYSVEQLSPIGVLQEQVVGVAQRPLTVELDHMIILQHLHDTDLCTRVCVFVWVSRGWVDEWVCALTSFLRDS